MGAHGSKREREQILALLQKYPSATCDADAPIYMCNRYTPFCAYNKQARRCEKVSLLTLVQFGRKYICKFKDDLTDSEKDALVLLLKYLGYKFVSEYTVAAVNRLETDNQMQTYVATRNLLVSFATAYEITVSPSQSLQTRVENFVRAGFDYESALIRATYLQVDLTLTVRNLSEPLTIEQKRQEILRAEADESRERVKQYSHLCFLAKSLLQDAVANLSGQGEQQNNQVMQKLDLRLMKKFVRNATLYPVEYERLYTQAQSSEQGNKFIALATVVVFLILLFAGTAPVYTYRQTQFDLTTHVSRQEVFNPKINTLLQEVASDAIQCAEAKGTCRLRSEDQILIDSLQQTLVPGSHDMEWDANTRYLRHVFGDLTYGLPDWSQLPLRTRAEVYTRLQQKELQDKLPEYNAEVQRLIDLHQQRVTGDEQAGVSTITQAAFMYMHGELNVIQTGANSYAVDSFAIPENMMVIHVRGGHRGSLNWGYVSPTFNVVEKFYYYLRKTLPMAAWSEGSSEIDLFQLLSFSKYRGFSISDEIERHYESLYAQDPKKYAPEFVTNIRLENLPTRVYRAGDVMPNNHYSKSTATEEQSMDAWVFDYLRTDQRDTVSRNRLHKMKYSTKEFIYDRYAAGKRVVLLFEFSCQGFAHDKLKGHSVVDPLAALSLKEQLEIPREYVEQFGTSGTATAADIARYETSPIFGKTYTYARPPRM